MGELIVAHKLGLLGLSDTESGSGKIRHHLQLTECADDEILKQNWEIISG